MKQNEKKRKKSKIGNSFCDLGSDDYFKNFTKHHIGRWKFQTPRSVYSKHDCFFVHINDD